ncbi:MAG: DUF1963 domain-containing protein [Bacteroidales bacterium]|nr:DUF1963 domain-containing protein [Bacteroidales bacterium]
MITIKTVPSEDVLYGQSKWWGFPDLPDDLDWPTAQAEDEGETFEDPLTFICQIRCSDLAALDPEGLLPHEGMLYFFAALDYFLGDLDAFLTPGMGEWPSEYFRVLYSPTCEGLNTHTLMYDEDTPAALPPEAIQFVIPSEAKESFTWLLGESYLEEVREAMPGLVPLLQIDENDDWGLRFFDCGMLTFMISPADLAARRFDRVRAHLYSA